MKLDRKVPPPVLMLTTLAIMYGISSLGFKLSMPTALVWILVLGFIAAGLYFAVTAIRLFKSHKTTVNPLENAEPSSLVVEGIYKITRNPMYVGLCCLLIAWGCYLQAPLALLGVAVFAWYMTQFQILPEEESLHNEFGDEFIRYKEQTRRWL